MIFEFSDVIDFEYLHFVHLLFTNHENNHFQERTFSLRFIKCFLSKKSVFLLLRTEHPVYIAHALTLQWICHLLIQHSTSRVFSASFFLVVRAKYKPFFRKIHLAQLVSSSVENHSLSRSLSRRVQCFSLADRFSSTAEIG